MEQVIEGLQIQVARGVKLLNRAKPGWENEIDLEDLSMINCLHCVLGQLFESYTHGLDKLGILDSSHYGFSSSIDLYPGYSHLQQEWIRQILALREGKRVSAEVEEPVLIGAE